MNLIDVDELKKKEVYIPCGTGQGLLFHGVTAATIDAMPIVPAKPIIKAKWMKTGPYMTADREWKKEQTCSLCNSTFVSDGNTPWSNHNYCPYCGAKMDGGKTDDAK